MPNLNLFEMLWQDLRRAVHKQMAKNLNELKKCCKKKKNKSNHPLSFGNIVAIKQCKWAAAVFNSVSYVSNYNT